jgi:hypothetical protein
MRPIGERVPGRVLLLAKPMFLGKPNPKHLLKLCATQQPILLQPVVVNSYGLKKSQKF